MKIPLLCAVVIVPVLTWVAVVAAEGSQTPSNPGSSSPILVELFTSEGCSSCPPADALLSKLDRGSQPGAQLVVLSEHVDYWNDLGWKDPYSSHFYSQRQSAYADRFRSGSVYTPQMIVDGTIEFVGGSSRSAQKAFAKAAGSPKVAIRLSDVTQPQANVLQAHLETDSLSEPVGSPEADIYVAVALNHAQSQVDNGENGGRRLEHVAVVQSLTKVGELRQGQTFAQDVRLKIASGIDPGNLRLIAFLQEPHQGKVVGATMRPLSSK